MSEKELLQGLPPYLFATAATISFALAIYLALHDKKGAATLLGAMALVAALLAYLPQLDSLSAFAVNVKLRSSLDRADEILGKLRQSDPRKRQTRLHHTRLGQPLWRSEGIRQTTALG